MAGVNLQAIYNRLAAAPRYHPMSANTFADWTMEAGDIVTVSRDGTGYASPVGTMTMKWNGKQQIQISSEGSKEREPISRVSAREYARGGGGASGMRGSQELYWEMFSEDGQLHAQIHATAEALTSDYSKKIGDTNIELRGVITQTAQSLTSDYTKKIGDQDAALRGVIRQTAESLTSDYNSKIDATESHLEQTAGQIRTSVSNLDDRLSTQIAQTDSRVGLSVGHVKFTSVVHKANKSAFPATGQAGTLYYADDTGKAYIYMPGTHSYELAQTDEYGNANYIKAGEIAISINESGQPEAKLDATRVLAGKGALTIDDLELPDWMDTTEGLIAEKATIVDLNALRARVGTLEADAITTQRLNSEVLSAKGLVIRETLSFTYGQTSYTMATLMAGISAVQIAGPTNNRYTLQYKNYGNDTWQDAQSFSRATSLSGAWSGDKYTVTASPQGNTRSIGFTSGADELLSIYGKSGEYAYRDGQGNINYHYLYKPVAVGSVNSGAAPTDRKTADILVDASLSYNGGYDAVGAPSVAFTAVDARATGNPSGTASIANKTGGGTRRTAIGMTMSRSVFTPSGGSTERCVNVSYNNTTVGRISVQTDYNAGFDADHTLVVADHEGTTQSSISLDPGDTMDIWPGMVLRNGITKKWGSKVSISVSSGGGGEPGSISIGDILATSYPTGTVARQISNLIASTSEDAVQFTVTCTCGAKKTYYIEMP